MDHVLPEDRPQPAITPTAEASSQAPELTIGLPAWFTSARSLRTPMRHLRHSPNLTFSKTDVFFHIEVVGGRIWLRPEGTKYFCGDLSEQEPKLVWATQGIPKPDLFEAKVEGADWKSKRGAVLTHPTLVEGLIPLISSLAELHGIAEVTTTAAA
jgi:hypothetical protein